MTFRKIIIILGILAAILLVMYLLGFFRAADDQPPGTQPTINGTL